MRNSTRALVACAALLGVASGSRHAAAQADVNPPPPNVLLLIDSSGSMEYKTGTSTLPVCNPTGTSEKSRWIDLIEVMTGTIQNYHCQAISRARSTFAAGEWLVSAINPADVDFLLPYNRPISNTCTFGPGTMPANAFNFSPPTFHLYSSVATTCTDWVTDSSRQSVDGLLDVYKGKIRFGLMTFDTKIDPSSGYSGTTPNLATGTQGTWSYFVGSPKQGKPAGCATLADAEVGARNAAAPAWEGRMVPFGPVDQTFAQLSNRNEEIQRVLLSTRPYGATPIAGILDDARAFLRSDTSTDPRTDLPAAISGQAFGPKDDAYVNGGCRKSSIILLTDGEPNLDLRPYCADTPPVGLPPGSCPYDVPYTIANALSTGTPSANVFVVGFAPSTVTVGAGSVDCTTMSVTDLTAPAGVCSTNPANKALQVCCTLNRIAYEGGTSRAYFANDPAALKAALSTILGAAGTATSRTVPSFGSASVSSDGFGAFRISSGVAASTLGLSNGKLERTRYQCVQNTGTGLIEQTPQPKDDAKGDDFIANVNSAGSSGRTFISVVGATVAGTVRSERAIRPYLAVDDGGGLYSGSQVEGGPTAFNSAVSALAMNVTTATAGCAGVATDAACRDRILKWTIGVDNGTTNPSYNRCPAPGVDCNLIADVLHSTPVVVPPPSEAVRDETYDAFAANTSRPTVVYTSTNDGFLHAFKASGVTTKTNNELWAFVPPAVLPYLAAQYPGSRMQLLDGAPQVKDVVATDLQVTDALGRPRFKLSRDVATARAGRNGLARWRTILVQGFGSTRAGYFALDVTDPTAPQFLWQLVSDANGNALFGNSSGTPLITTVFVAPDVNSAPEEVAVAVLPGGGAPVAASTCSRIDATPLSVDAAHAPRSKVRCYDPAVLPRARSLTVVRLDTGEIMRTFRVSTSDVPAALSGRVTTAKFDSPVTGTPVAFPPQAGAIAQRVFVGDADGTMWTLDVSAKLASQWQVRMFFDLYTGLAADAGEPIQTPPVMSVTPLGEITVAVATGDQELFTPGVTTRMWSLTEAVQSDGSLRSLKNWYWTFDPGERVTGPISLFDNYLFFSTFTPSTGAVCQIGTSRVFSMHYRDAYPDGLKSKGGTLYGRAPFGPGNPNPWINGASNSALTNATIFGVGVALLPSCYGSNTSFNDAYLGYGKHTSNEVRGQAKATLVFHTGQSGTTSVPGGEVKTVSFDLAAPRFTARLDSWAAIVE